MNKRRLKIAIAMNILTIGLFSIIYIIAKERDEVDLIEAINKMITWEESR